MEEHYILYGNPSCLPSVPGFEGKIKTTSHMDPIYASCHSRANLWKLQFSNAALFEVHDSEMNCGKLRWLSGIVKLHFE